MYFSSNTSERLIEDTSFIDNLCRTSTKERNMTMKAVTIFALVLGSLTVTNLAAAVESGLMNQDDPTVVAAVLQESSVQQNSGTHTKRDHKVFDNYILPVKGWSIKFRHHRNDRHHNNNRFRGGYSGHRGKHFRFDHGYSHKYGNYSRYGKGYTHRYRGHSKFKGHGFKDRSIRRHRNRW